MRINDITMSPMKTDICIAEPATINSAFERLPEEIIVQILRQSDPNGFASLVLLNRRWRLMSSQAYLYIYHLLRCPSYSASSKTSSVCGEDIKNLPRLRRLFAREIKRNLFEAYLRPAQTTIRLIPSSSNQFLALDKESFRYSLSPQGHYILADSSCRIHILDATGPEIIVKKGFKIIQRPVLTTITDDGYKLALFYTNLQVNVYDLSDEQPRKIRTIILDHSPRSIALSPNGSVLAAAYDSGIEVSSLNPTNLSTDRRSVKCYTVDSLSFSRDGTQILGTTVHSQNPSTVVLTAPYFDTGAALPEDSISALWTTSILFPNGSRDCSHAALLPSSSEEDASWAFTYDRAFETFRAVRIDDLRNGTTYFTGPVPNSSLGSRLIPSSLPAVNKSGELVVSGFHGFIWLYGIPEDLDAISNSKNGTYSSTEAVHQTSLNYMPQDGRTIPLKSSNKYPEDINKIPQWQLLCDRARNTFVEGRKIAFMENVSKMVWVDSLTFLCGDRLIAVASDVGNHPLVEENNSVPFNEGRIIILDFNHSPVNGQKKSLIIEIDMSDVQTLDTEDCILENEAPIVRKRSLTQQRGSFSHEVEQESIGYISSLYRRDSNLQLNSEFDLTSQEEDAFDAPYSHTNPRSGSTLRRAATAAAVNRRLNSQIASSSHIFEYRRADGREEYPHESDADDWVPPPPPYSLKSTTEFSGYLPRTLSEANGPILHGIIDSNTPDTNPDISCEAQNTSSVTKNQMSEILPNVWAHNNEVAHSSEQVYSDGRETQSVDNALSNDEFDDRYDVSPPRTPHPEFGQSSLVLREPVSISQESSFDESTLLTSRITLSEQFVPNYLRDCNLRTELSTPITENYEQVDEETSKSENFLVRSTHSEGFPVDDNTHNNFEGPSKLNCQISATKLQGPEERLSLKLPFSNKMASVAKAFRTQRPRLPQRTTAPSSLSLDILLTDGPDSISNHQSPSSARENLSSSVNIPDQKQDRRGCKNTPISIHQPPQTTSSCHVPVHCSVPQLVLDHRFPPLSLDYPFNTSPVLQDSNALGLHVENDRSSLSDFQLALKNPQNIHNESSEILSATPTCNNVCGTRRDERDALQSGFQENQNSINTTLGVITENELVEFDKSKHTRRSREFKEKHCKVM